jgi:hypothetical protein
MLPLVEIPPFVKKGTNKIRVSLYAKHENNTKGIHFITQRELK